MEHGAKMEQQVFRKGCGVCGSVVMYAWFPLLASVAWHNKIKLIDDHISNTKQKRNFPIFEHFDV